MTIFKKNRGLITGLVVMISINMVLFTGGFSMFSYMLTLRDNISEEREQVFVLDIKQGNKQSIKNLLKETKSDRELIYSYFIEDEEETILFLERIENIAQKLGLELSTEISVIRVSLDEKKESDVLRLSMDLGGEFKSIYRFVELLELMPYKVSFSGVDIYSSSSEGGIIKWKGSLSVDVVSFIET